MSNLEINYDFGLDLKKPRHCFHHEPVQFRLKVQTYTHAAPEFTIQKVDMSRDAEGYQRAWENKQSSYGFGRAARTERRSQSEECVERATRRAKTNCRKQVIELAPNAMVTFTTREVISLDALLKCWQRFRKLMESAGFPFEYVCVPERHTDPTHLHLHVAYRGNAHIKTLRRLWHISLEAMNGRRVTKTLYGSEAPGNIDVQRNKSRDPLKCIRKIAKYISKYITKDLISEFNRKRYWPSKGISLDAAKIYYLSSLNQLDAIREGCRMMGQWDETTDTVAQLMFCPSDRLAWFAVDPERTPDPPLF